MVVLLGYCIPPERSWNPTIPGHCMSATALDVGGRAGTGMTTQVAVGLFLFCLLCRRLTTEKSITLPWIFYGLFSLSTWFGNST